MDTIFVKNVKDEGPAHRAGLRTGELSQFPGSSHPLGLFFYPGRDSKTQVLGRLLPPAAIHTGQGFLGGAPTRLGLLTRGPVPCPQETGW